MTRESQNFRKILALRREHDGGGFLKLRQKLVDEDSRQSIGKEVSFDLIRKGLILAGKTL
jgi:hypothetical protein